MNITKAIKRLLLEKETTQANLAAMLDIDRMQLNRMILKKDLRIHAGIEKIADALGYDVKLIFVDRESSKEIEVD